LGRVPGLTLPEQLNFEQEKTNIFLVDRSAWSICWKSFLCGDEYSAQARDERLLPNNVQQSLVTGLSRILVTARGAFQQIDTRCRRPERCSFSLAQKFNCSGSVNPEPRPK